MALFFAMFAFMWVHFANVASHHGRPAEPPMFFFYLFPLHFLTMLLMFGLTATYVVHAFRTDLVDPDKRVIWVIALIFGNILAFPIYWYLYMWRPLRPLSTNSRTPDGGTTSNESTNLSRSDMG